MTTVALFFGGPGSEASVSVASAKNIAANFPRDKYRLLLCYWHKDRRFYLPKSLAAIKNLRSARPINGDDFSRLFDVALLMTHGRYGEDGALQGILEARGIKYCGCHVLSSALCMDKSIFKDLMAGHGISQVRYQTVDFSLASPAEIKKTVAVCRTRFRFPWYVKPANSGSSVGISRVTAPGQIPAALKLARRYDSKVIIEEGLVSPKEIEVAVLGNAQLLVSRPGELRLAKDFYNYEDKYKLGQARQVIPAAISPAQAKNIRALARTAYRLADCRGFARVDFFLARGRIYLNEINTLPGFTDISMFPQLLQDQGLSYRQLIEKIIALAY